MRAFKDTSYGDLTGVFHKGNLPLGRSSLTSLEGAPDTVRGFLNIMGNELTSLDFFPNKVTGDITITGNPLTSLVGLPDEVEGGLFCVHTNIKDLVGIPTISKSCVMVGGPNLESLYTGKGTIVVKDYFDCTESPKLKDPKQEIIENQIKALKYVTDYGTFTFKSIEREFVAYVPLDKRVKSQGFRALLGMK